MNTFRGHTRISASRYHRQRCVVHDALRSMQLAPCQMQVTQASNACAMPEKVRNREQL